MQAGDIAHEVVKAVAGNAACRVHVDAVKALHYLGVVGDVKIGHDRLAEALHLDVAAVVRAYRDGGVYHVWDGHHDGLYPLAHLRGRFLKLGKAVGVCLDLRLGLLGLGKLRRVLLRLTHELADLLGKGVAAGAKLVCLGQRRAVASVKLHDLVHQRQLLLLILLPYVLPDCLRVLADKLYIKHF